MGRGTVPFGAEEGGGFFGVGGAEVDDNTGCQSGVLSLFPAVVALVRVMARVVARVVAWRTKLVHVENGGKFGRWPWFSGHTLQLYTVDYTVDSCFRRKVFCLFCRFC